MKLKAAATLNGCLPSSSLIYLIPSCLHRHFPQFLFCSFRGQVNPRSAPFLSTKSVKVLLSDVTNEIQRYWLLLPIGCCATAKWGNVPDLMEERSWRSSWLLPPNMSPALLCPFTSDTLVYPQAACVLIFCHVMCCPHRHAQLHAQRPTYLDIHKCWITLLVHS